MANWIKNKISSNNGFFLAVTERSLYKTDDKLGEVL